MSESDKWIWGSENDYVQLIVKNGIWKGKKKVMSESDRENEDLRMIKYAWELKVKQWKWKSKVMSENDQWKWGSENYYVELVDVRGESEG